MANNGLINYQYTAIADGVRQMQQVNQNIRDQVTDLQKQVKTLLADFTGASAEGYDVAANKISTDLNKSNDDLDALALKVRTGSENMNTADGNQRKRFGH